MKKSLRECYCPIFYTTMKLSIIKTSIIALLTIGCAATTFAQTTAPKAKVSGALQDMQGKPMDYATVSLISTKDSSIIEGTLSTEAGLYTLDHVKPGTYLVAAT